MSARPAPGGDWTRISTEDGDCKLVTQRQAAELAGCSKDTIIRARLAGRLPHATLEGHTWLVPVSDLVAAGLYDPNASEPRRTAPPWRDDASQRSNAASLAEAQAKVASLEDLVARQDDELRFLRQLIADALAGLRAGE